MEKKNGFSAASSEAPGKEGNPKSFRLSFSTTAQRGRLESRCPLVSTKNDWHATLSPGKAESSLYLKRHKAGEREMLKRLIGLLWPYGAKQRNKPVLKLII